MEYITCRTCGLKCKKIYSYQRQINEQAFGGKWRILLSRNKKNIKLSGWKRSFRTWWTLKKEKQSVVVKLVKKIKDKNSKSKSFHIKSTPHMCSNEEKFQIFDEYWFYL